MILTLRGTSGSGKTWLARRIMEHYAHRCAVHIPRRKRPLYYDFFREPPPPDNETEEQMQARIASRGQPLRVLGHYESPTGGGDTISQGLDFIAELTQKGHDEGYDVLYEGLVISSDFKRIAGFHAAGLPVGVIVLNTSLADCLASVNARRAAKGKTEPVNPKATREKHRAVELMVPRFRAAGVPVWHVDREEAYSVAKELLKL